MRSDRELIAMHRDMRKTAFERLCEPIVKALTEKTSEATKEAGDVRTRNPR